MFTVNHSLNGNRCILAVVRSSVSRTASSCRLEDDSLALSSRDIECMRFVSDTALRNTSRSTRYSTIRIALVLVPAVSGLFDSPARCAYTDS